MEGEKQKVSDEEEGCRYREMLVQKGTSKGNGWGWFELEEEEATEEEMS
jgi:hypothetical protein